MELEEGEAGYCEFCLILENLQSEMRLEVKTEWQKVRYNFLPQNVIIAAVGLFH